MIPVVPISAARFPLATIPITITTMMDTVLGILGLQVTIIRGTTITPNMKAPAPALVPVPAPVAPAAAGTNPTPPQREVFSWGYLLLFFPRSRIYNTINTRELIKRMYTKISGVNQS